MVVEEPTAAVFTSASNAESAVLVPTAPLEATFPWLVAPATSSRPMTKVAELVEGVPKEQVEKYAEAARRLARVCEVDPQVWFASARGLEGAWGEGDSPEEALRDFHDAVVGWVAVKRRLGLEVPVLEGIDLNGHAAPPDPA
jgi:predicted RNase H-like HicB family nuclease